VQVEIFAGRAGDHRAEDGQSVDCRHNWRLHCDDVTGLCRRAKGFDFAVVIGVMAAAGTPQAAMTRISQEIAEVVKHPEVIKNFQTAVIDPVGGNAQAYGQAITRENEAMARAAKVADLKAE